MRWSEVLAVCGAGAKYCLCGGLGRVLDSQSRAQCKGSSTLSGVCWVYLYVIKNYSFLILKMGGAGGMSS